MYYEGKDLLRTTADGDMEVFVAGRWIRLTSIEALVSHDPDSLVSRLTEAPFKDAIDGITLYYRGLSIPMQQTLTGALRRAASDFESGIDLSVMPEGADDPQTR